MITDSCRCGAEFATQQRCHSEEAEDHAAWLVTHTSCREQRQVCTCRPDCAGGPLCTCGCQACGDIRRAVAEQRAEI